VSESASTGSSGEGTKQIPGFEPTDAPGATDAAGREAAAESGTDGQQAAPASGSGEPEAEGHGGGVGGKALAGVALAALGVVFGDIGTSPLYALRTVFTIDDGAVKATPDDVYGVISLMFWSITIIVSVKYVTILLRADNNGEGGVMALAALARRLYGKNANRAAALLVIGIVGVSLFYGDSIITPAVSVLSAVEGLEVATPSVSHLVVPIAAVILTILFAAQRFGTARVGKLFGPVMLLWFAVLAVAGLGSIVKDPTVLRGLSPTYAITFTFAHPGITFVAMGAVVLVITGAEALYADLGHFGRRPIHRAWFFVVFPALTLNYLGQASMILNDPSTRSNPFFLLIPDWGRIPVVILATMATVIASQAVISGAFSLSAQAVQLGLLPPLNIRQTSEKDGGQIYLPAVNVLLFLGVMAVMLTFRSSERLATAYGVSVTGALVVDTVLLLIVARRLWNWKIWQMAIAAIAFGGLELTFLAGNLSKVIHGGWVPLLIAAAVITVMTTWRRGRLLVMEERTEQEGSLEDFIAKVQGHSIPRVPGVAIFPHPNKDTTPLALRANVEHNHVLHERVIIVSAITVGVPHVPAGKKYVWDDLGYAGDGIEHLLIKSGFSDDPNIPAALQQACVADVLDLSPADIEDASYFVSRGALRPSRGPSMVRWRKKLFVALAQNAANPAARFGLPPHNTVTMGSDVDF
jgi:KUP system potassium uptake protein